MSCSPFNFKSTYTQLPSLFFTEAYPDRAPSPTLICLNHQLGETLGVAFSDIPRASLAALFSGSVCQKGEAPLAQAYAGHQFGHFTVLGDGRAHLLGEHLTPNSQRVDIQLKGSGRTSYSRSGDGKAVLGPMLREYLISEAMHALHIPTTRSLAVVTTGEEVLRDQPKVGAVLTRVAASHIRVGTFEFAAMHQDTEATEALMRYTIMRHYPSLMDADNHALSLLEAVIEKQIDLMVHWMRVGFVHGVMNTDNMAVSGETIDYGPCAFMDHYHPQTVFSSIDRDGRYAFSNQPKIAQWNLARFAETLLPLIDNDFDQALAKAQVVIERFPQQYEQKWYAMMRHKLGLHSEQKDDPDLIHDLLDWMQQSGADYTHTFRCLSDESRITQSFYQEEAFKAWLSRWQDRVKFQSGGVTSALATMRDANPAVIPRNDLVETVLAAAEDGDLGPFEAFLEVLQDPYTERSALEVYQKIPDAKPYQTFCGT